MKQSFLINDRIYLRAVEPEDIDVMYEMENDPLMWDISSFTVPYSRYVLRQYIEGSQSDMFADKQLRLMIIRREDNRILGTIDVTARVLTGMRDVLVSYTHLTLPTKRIV